MFEARTVIVALVVGVGVTVRFSPSARPGGRFVTAPMAAISDQQGGADVSFRRRFAWGGSFALLGAVLLGVGLSQPAVELVGLGAVGLFVGVAMLAPAVARPLSGAIGRPLARVLGMAGQLGRENSMRSPRRTAQTASALMVGFALVSAIAVFGASASKSATSSIDHTVSADLIVTTSSSNSSGSFSPGLVKVVSAVPGVTASSTVYGGQFEVGQSPETLTALSTEGLAQTVILRMVAGSPSTLAGGALLVGSTTATLPTT